MTIQMKAIEQYFHVVLFIILSKVVLTSVVLFIILRKVVLMCLWNENWPACVGPFDFTL